MLLTTCRFGFRSLLTFAFTGLLLLPAWAQEIATPPKHAPSFWKVEGKHNTVWLFGSVHVLTEAHYPLAEKVEKAFAASPNMVVEVDIVNMDPAAMQRVMATKSLLPPGTTLKTLLGEQYPRASQLAAANGYDLEQLKTMRPWLITMMVTMNEFVQAGYTPDQGVEAYFLKRASSEQKAIKELETLESQIGIFAGMDKQTETAMLMQTLEELQSSDEQIAELITAWESGKLHELEATLLEDFADYPGVYRTLVTDRNQNWVSQLKPLLINSKKDHFVVVGALHLVGKEGVVNLLRKEGFAITQQ